MNLRPVKQKDLSRIDEIYRQFHEEQFSLPSLSNTVTSAVVEENGEIIGFGVVKILAEAVMVLDLDKSKGDRLKAMQILMDEALRGCHEQGIEQLHVFVKDEKLSRLLQRKYGFKITSGAALVLEV